MYKTSKEEVSEEKSSYIFAAITLLFKVVSTTLFLGIILMIFVGIYLAFYGHSGSFYEQAEIAQLAGNVGLFAAGMSVVSLFVLGLVWLIACIWTPPPWNLFS